MNDQVQRDVVAGKATEITRIEIWSFSYAMDNVGPHGIDLPGAQSIRSRLAIEIETRDGATGQYMGGQVNAYQQAVTAAKAVLGLDAFARSAAYDRMRHALQKEDKMGAGVIDIAMWDLAGKRLGASVSQLLGASREHLPAYASTWFGGDGGGLSTPEAYADFAEECYELGYRGFKMHGWTDGRAERDIAAILALGKRVGGRMKLMHDAHNSFTTFADALAVGRACDEAGFFWLEDPYADGGLSAFSHKRLREMIKTPLLMGEMIRHLESMATMTIAGGTDILRADPDFDMGITGTVKRAHFAEALGLDIELHAPGPAQRHCMAAIRNTSFYELSMVGPSRGCFIAPVYTCGYAEALDDIAPDGTVPVPTGPGLGVSYDWDYIRKNTLSHTVLR
jgi:L-alanine-DL-glutamate epimerase-like enolase superfamily enzyme